MSKRKANNNKRAPARRRNRSDAPAHANVMARGQTLRFSNTGTVFNLVRSGNYSFLTKGASDKGFALTFVPSNLVTTSDFTALFDSYRVLWYEVTVQWVPDGGYLQAPTMYMIQDWDGIIGGAPTSLNQVLGRSNLKTVNFSVSERCVTFRVDRPGVLATTPNAGAGMVRRAPWLDLADLGEVHYGLYTWLAFYNTTVASGDVTVLWRAHVQLRGVR